MKYQFLGGPQCLIPRSNKYCAVSIEPEVYRNSTYIILELQLILSSTWVGIPIIVRDSDWLDYSCTLESRFTWGAIK